MLSSKFIVYKPEMGKNDLKSFDIGPCDDLFNGSHDSKGLRVIKKLNKQIK